MSPFGIFFLFISFLCQCSSSPTKRSFVVDYESNTFLKDGQPFRYISGSMHYFRIPYQYWEDRLYKARKAGLNAIETYVAWNVHEMFQGNYDFDKQNDLISFLQIAQQQDLLVILRPGPYICAEWEYGGFPYWLINAMDRKKIRTNDPTYLSLVDEWFSQLLTRIQPLLYQNGGPIISVQVENEYGSFGCDHDYISAMEKMVRKYLGDDIILFTTDGAGENMVKCGTLPSLYTTVDFGPGGDVSKYFAVQRKFQNQGPLVNSEYYTGWLDHWGEKHHTTDSTLVTKYLDKIMALNASVNLYMFHGGTNFKFMNGANWGGHGIQPVTSSYDYDSPLSEAGDPTQKYWNIQHLLSKYGDIPPGPQPKPTIKKAYGKVMSDIGSSLFDMTYLMKYVNNVLPLTFEDVDLAYGYLWYKTKITDIAAGNLDLGKFHDRASVYVDREYQGTLNSIDGSVLAIKSGKSLVIVVENEGRIGYGSHMLDPQKGILGNVTLNEDVLTNWTMYPYGLTKDTFHASMLTTGDEVVRKVWNNNHENQRIPHPPAFFYFYLEIDNEASDTYLKLENWGQGFAAINGCVEKYWTTAGGPQQTLFIPRTCFETNSNNRIVIFETQQTPDVVEKAYIEFVDAPIFV